MTTSPTTTRDHRPTATGAVTASATTTHAHGVTTTATTPPTTAAHWLRIAERYATSSPRRSVQQLLATVALLIAGYAGMLWTVDRIYPLTLVCAAFTALVMIRGFSIQHDCQHGSYFASRRISDWVGRALCLVTLVPHGHHRRLHAVHHAVVGHLDKRDDSGMFPRTRADFDLLTVREYRALSPQHQRLYRFLRNPLVIFTVVPLYLFLFSYRFPFLHPAGRARGWISTQLTNLALALALTAAALTLGPAQLTAIFLPTVAIYSIVGAWMFYVQHQHVGTYWEHRDTWEFREASLHGSSHLALPRPLGWLTGSIGLHAIHHLCSRIPNYRLQECLDDHPTLAQINRVTILDSLRGLRLALWDERSRQLIRFADLGDVAPTSDPAIRILVES